MFLRSRLLLLILLHDRSSVVLSRLFAGTQSTRPTQHQSRNADQDENRAQEEIGECYWERKAVQSQVKFQKLSVENSLIKNDVNFCRKVKMEGWRRHSCFCYEKYAIFFNITKNSSKYFSRNDPEKNNQILLKFRLVCNL